MKGLEAQGVLLREDAPRDAPFPPLDPAAGTRRLCRAQAAAGGCAARRRGGRRLFRARCSRALPARARPRSISRPSPRRCGHGRQALVLLPEIALSVEFLDRVEARFGARPAEWHSGVTQAARRRRLDGGGDRRRATRRRRAFRALPALRRSRAHRRRRGARRFLQAGGGRALQRPRHGGAARLDRGGDGGARLRHAEPRELGQRRRRQVSPAGPARAVRCRRAARRCGRSICGSTQPEQGRWISPAARARGQRRGWRRASRRCSSSTAAALRRSPSAAPAASRSAATSATRAWSSIASEAPGLPPVRRDQADPDRLPVLRRGGADGGARARAWSGLPKRRPRSGRRRDVAILSSDLADSARALKARIDQIAAGGADLVIGTQIVSKGHNFPHLTLVGVIDADLGLQGGDLRAAEKTFQLIRQVAGRAGRVERPGRGADPDPPARASRRSARSFRTTTRASGGGGRERRAGRSCRPTAASRASWSPGPTRRGPGTSRARWRARRRSCGTPARRSSARRPRRSPASAGATGCGCWCGAAKGVALQAALRDWTSRVAAPSSVRVTVDIDPQSFF